MLEWEAQLEAASNGPPVSALAFNAGTPYVAGSFNRLGGEPRRFLGAVDAVTAQGCSWDPRPSFRSGSAGSACTALETVPTYP